MTQDSHRESPEPPPASATPSPARGRGHTVRIVTYNVRRCLGVDGQLSPQRIGEVLAAFEPDIVALQELDIRRPRTRSVDQAQAIADHLSMSLHFHPVLHVMEERYGDAVLTHLPSRLVHTAALPAPERLKRIEPRGALWVEIDVAGIKLQVVNTHLGLVGRERVMQARELLGPDWLGHPDCRDPAVLVGDLNAPPRSAAYRLLTRHLVDSQLSPPGRRPKRTFPVRWPVLRLDHVMFRGAIQVEHVEVPRHGLVALASDHLPLVVDLRLEDKPTKG